MLVRESIHPFTRSVAEHFNKGKKEARLRSSPRLGSRLPMFAFKNHVKQLKNPPKTETVILATPDKCGLQAMGKWLGNRLPISKR